MAETTACRRLSHGERNIRPPQSEVILPRKGFCAHKVGFDVSILICVRCAVLFFVERGFLPFVASHPLASIGRLKDRDPCVEKWKRCAEINNK